MNHLPQLIADLGYILATAAVVSIVFKKLGLPVVAGYLIAGFFVGPHFPYLHAVKETESIRIWAELGVIFIMFNIGLEFSFKKLTALGRQSVITGLFEIPFLFGLTFLLGKAFGWNTMDCLFFGGMLSISSTSVIVKSFEEFSMRSRRFAQNAMGILIIEDLVAILLLVLLSTVAVTQTFSGMELLSATGRLVFYLVIWFVVGLTIIPRLLKRIRPLLNSESRLLLALGLCLTMVFLAVSSGFSSALGALVMGSILAETAEGKEIEHLLSPIQKLFSAIFFVSVGVLFDPSVFASNAAVISIIVVAFIVISFSGVTIGSLLSGQNVKNAVMAGLSLTTIGEFSFIIANLGNSLNVTSEFLLPIAVTVAVVTSFMTPFAIKNADRIAEWIERKVPAGLLIRLNSYDVAMERKSTKNLFHTVWTNYGPKLLINSVLVIAITLLIKTFLFPQMLSHFEVPAYAILVGALLSLILSSPFFWVLLFFQPKHREQLRELQIGILFARVAISMALVFFVLAQFTTGRLSSVIVLSLALVVAGGMAYFSAPIYKYFEKQFLSNLSSLEEPDEIKVKAPEISLAPWDATLGEYMVEANSSLVGKTMQESRIKEDFGVMVALIQRGQRRILAPTRDERFMPMDRVLLIGEESELQAIEPAFDMPTDEMFGDTEEDYGLEPYVLNPTSPYLGKTIRDSGLREAISGLIVGIERAGQRILNPDSAMSFETGDIVWIVGHRQKIKSL